MTPISVALDERLATVDARLRAVLRHPDGRARPAVFRKHRVDRAACGVRAWRDGPDHRRCRTGRLGAHAQRIGRDAGWGMRGSSKLAAPDATTLAGEFASHVLRADRRSVWPSCNWPCFERRVVTRIPRSRRTGRQSCGPAWRVITWNGIIGACEDPRAARRRVCSTGTTSTGAGFTRASSHGRSADADPFGRLLALHASHPSDDPLERALYVDLRTSLADNVLACADRAAGAAGMSLRFHSSTATSWCSPRRRRSAVKQRGGTGIHALRRLLLRQRAADADAAGRAAGRRVTTGCARPSRRWCRRCCSRPGSTDAASSRAWRCAGSGSEHRSGRRDHAWQLWSLLMLEFWFRQCVDGDAAGRTARICRAEGGGLTCVELRDSPRPSVLGPDERHRAQHDARRARAPRSGRRRPLGRRARRARAPPPEHRRPRRRASAAVERDRRRSGSPSTARSTTTPTSARSSKPRGTSTARGRDTETIVHAYEQWGDECVHRFRGMFAFGAVGRAAPAAAAGARPAGRQAALLGAGRRPRCSSRPRSRRSSRAASIAAAANDARAVGGARDALHVRHRDAVRGHPQAAARPPARSSSTGACGSSSTGTCRSTGPIRSSNGSATRELDRAVPIAAPGVGPAAADGGRAARHVPLGRHRQQRRSPR